ncbi:MAG: sensor histidine kinase N-terminal domain-containing protein [Burkholderiaceae bacterium]
MTSLPRAFSLRRHLLMGILLPIGVFMLLNTAMLYRQALAAVNTAYDRTLLASAKSIGESLEVEGEGDQAQFRTTVPYSALEAFEADNRSRMVYRISTAKGELIGGSSDLPSWHGRIPDTGPYAALVDFYDGRLQDGLRVRVAVLLQPVASEHGRGMATIQVAETLELRRTLARSILIDTLWRQALLAAIIAVVVVLVVQAATRPVRSLSAELRVRPEGDLTPLSAQGMPRELRPMVEATNHVMARLQRLLDHQKRFMRDASHQLRTPLAVLKVQVQSALRGDIAPLPALREIRETVERATQLANQMLALAQVEQLRQQADTRMVDMADTVRSVALDIAPLMAEKDLEFEIQTQPARLQCHEWMVRELTRNLLHNAIRHSAQGARLSVQLVADAETAALTVSDRGPGIAAELKGRLFQPFSSGNSRGGSGLGLVICQEIALAMRGSITLDNRTEHGRVMGLDATVRLPLVQNAPQ